MTIDAAPETKRSALPLIFALVGAATYVVAFAVGEALDDTPAEQSAAQWAATGVIVGVVLVGLAIPFSLRAMKRGPASIATTTLVFGILSILGMVVFWAGLPFVFGATAIGLGLTFRNQTGALAGKVTAGMGLGAVALIASAAIALMGN